MHFKDRTNIRYGKLTAIEYLGKSVWKCRCDCGRIITVNGSSLRQGVTRSCGCGTMSQGEENILKILKNNNIPYIYNEAYFDDLIVGKGKGRYDFVLYPNTEQMRLIEFDGEQHYKEWNLSKETLQERKNRDIIKNNYALSHKVPLVRIPYWEKDNINLELLFNDKYLVKSAE